MSAFDTDSMSCLHSTFYVEYLHFYIQSADDGLILEVEAVFSPKMGVVLGLVGPVGLRLRYFMVDHVILIVQG